jgi:hypothetical protein
VTAQPEPASTFPQTREEFGAYKARLEAAGFTVLTRWRKGLRQIRLGDVVLSEDTGDGNG